MAGVGESVFHLTLHTAGFRLAPVLICQKCSICIHQDSLRSQEGLGSFSNATQRQMGASDLQATVRWESSSCWDGRRDQVFVKAQFSGGMTSSKRRLRAQRS